MRNATGAVGALAALALAGCMVGPSYSRPPALTAPADHGQAPAEYREANGWKQAQPADSTLRADWWRVFGSQQLDDLEEQVDVQTRR